MKISVIIPIYKAEPYLCRCLNSVVNQTYQNLEIILVDDGSPDRCGLICDEYAKHDSRFVVLHTTNQGTYKARNLALDVACGDYIGFVDADDWLEQRMYEELLELALKHNADITQCEIVNEGVYAQTRSKHIGYTKIYYQNELICAMFQEEITHGLINKLFRADIWTNRRFLEGYYHVDAMMMAQVDSFCNIFVRIDAALYHYNTTNPSITRGRKKLIHVKSMKKLFSIYSSMAESNKMEGSFFICREIPSIGRLFTLSKEISVKILLRHIRYMHRIFRKHWGTARTTREYHNSPKAKKFLWHIYYYCPTMASLLVYWYTKLFKNR
ncbi:MAG: glycosyltransferase [Anaerotruncus sp.]|nr:glycosyltransferase [Anaerotruncus sp.]